jgi:hypothetical protein
MRWPNRRELVCAGIASRDDTGNASEVDPTSGREHGRFWKAAMNPDVFITIVFVGIAFLVALGASAIVVREIQRDEARGARDSTRSKPDERPTHRTDAAPH